MFKLVVLCLTLLNLVSVKGAAADPPKPKMNDTFHATGTVVVDVGDSIMAGTFEIARNQSAKMGVESESYGGKGLISTDKALLRYDKNFTYYIRGEGANPNCFAEDRNFNKMPEFWEWLDGATYVNRTIKKEVYSFWVATVGGVQFELGTLAPTKANPKPKVQYIFNRKTIESTASYTFKTYSAQSSLKIDKKLFDIPTYCS